MNNLPTQPGWYWCQRKELKFSDVLFVKEGTWEVCLIKKGFSDYYYADGFGDMELEEIGYNWVQIFPPDKI